MPQLNSITSLEDLAVELCLNLLSLPSPPEPLLPLPQSIGFPCSWTLCEHTSTEENIIVAQEVMYLFFGREVFKKSLCYVDVGKMLDTQWIHCVLDGKMNGSRQWQLVPQTDLSGLDLGVGTDDCPKLRVVSSLAGPTWGFPARHGGTPTTGWFLLRKIP